MGTLAAERLAKAVDITGAQASYNRSYYQSQQVAKAL
jgi:hypothetical protein